MGCGASRFDKRNAVCDDMNTCGLQFVGGEGQQIDWCPLDKVIVAYFENIKKPFEKLGELPFYFKVDGLTMDEENAQKLGLELYLQAESHIELLMKTFERVFYVNSLDNSVAEKENKVLFNKYSVKDGISTM